MSRHQQLSGRRRLLQKTEPNANRFLRIMFESIVPVGVVETDGEDGVARECQALAAGGHADHAMPGSVATGTPYDHARCHFGLLFEHLQLTAICRQELLRGRPQHFRHRCWHGCGREIGRRPEIDLGACNMDPKVGSQSILNLIHEQAADVVHVHMGDDHIGYGSQIDAGGFQPPRNLTDSSCCMKAAETLSCAGSEPKSPTRNRRGGLGAEQVVRLTC